MASEAHCAYCFETLAASLEKRPALSLRQVEALWDKYTATTSTPEADVDATSPAKPAAISRLLSPSTASSASSSADSTPPTGASSAAGSAGTSVSSLSSTLQQEEGEEEETAFPLFVTWNTLSKGGEKRLRGCIGTFEPLELEEGLGSYALTRYVLPPLFPFPFPFPSPHLPFANTLLD
jgi:hypothetical protein